MLNDTQKQLVLDWFNEKAPRRVCPVCSSGKPFLVNEEVVAVSTVGYAPDTGYVFRRDQGKAYLAVICTHCAHVQLFDAVAMGVVNPLPMGQPPITRSPPPGETT